MRNFGGILLLGGIIGFLYCSSEMPKYEPVPEGRTAMESLRYPSGRYEVGRWAGACAAGFGVLLLMFPKGR